MKVRISYSVEVADKVRRAIRAYYGQSGLASREEIQRWFTTYGDTMDNEIDGIYERAIAEEKDNDNG